MNGRPRWLRRRSCPRPSASGPTDSQRTRRKGMEHVSELANSPTRGGGPKPTAQHEQPKNERHCLAPCAHNGPRSLSPSARSRLRLRRPPRRVCAHIPGTAVGPGGVASTDTSDLARPGNLPGSLPATRPTLRASGHGCRHLSKARRPRALPHSDFFSSVCSARAWERAPLAMAFAAAFMACRAAGACRLQGAQREGARSTNSSSGPAHPPATHGARVPPAT